MAEEFHLVQGSVLRIGRFPTLTSPRATVFPQEAGEIRADDSLAVIDYQIGKGLAVVINQDCDLERSIDVEPYLQVAGLRTLTKEEEEEIGPNRRLSMRYRPFPDPTGGDADMVLDIRVVATVERLVIDDPSIEKFPCPLDEAARSDLREWLAARFGRAWFDTAIDKQLIRPSVTAIEALVRRSTATPAPKVLRALRWFGVRYHPPNPMVSLLFLYDPVILTKVGGDASAVVGARKELARDIHARIAAAGGSYRPDIKILNPNETWVSEFLSYTEVVVDLPSMP